MAGPAHRGRHAATIRWIMSSQRRAGSSGTLGLGPSPLIAGLSALTRLDLVL